MKTLEGGLAEICKERIDENAKMYKSGNYKSIDLTDEQQDILVAKILLLPDKYIDLFIGFYLCEMNDSELEDITGIENGTNYIYYFLNSFTWQMGLSENTVFSNNSIKLVISKVSKESLSLIDKAVTDMPEPKYSMKHKRAINKIIPYYYKDVIIIGSLKRVASIALIIVTAFSIFLTVNVSARERFIEWIVETFPQYSHFFIDIPIEENEDSLLDFEIESLISNMEITEFNQSSKRRITMYSDGQDNYFEIIQSVGYFDMYLNTEDVEVNASLYNDIEYTHWSKDGINHIMWKVDNNYFLLMSNLTEDKAFEIILSFQY